MKIGFDAKRAFHNNRGIGNYSRDLLAGLSRYFPKEEYILFTPPIKDENHRRWAKDYDNFTIFEPKTFFSRKFSSAWRSVFLTSELKNHDLDIFHGLSHELPPGIEKSGTKSIVTIHDLIFIRFPEFFPWIDRKVYMRKVKYACEAADIVLAICEQTKNDLINILNVKEEKIRVCYQSCNPRFYSPMEESKVNSILQKYGLTKNYILNVGAIEPRKNVINLIKAFGNLKKSSNYHLVIVGNGGEYKTEVESLIKARDLEERVTILSNVTNVDLPALYQGASLFCYPSHFEGFGIPIIESLFSETPVITSKGSVFPEAGGEHTIYIDPNSIDELSEAIEKVLTDEELRHTMIQRGRNFVEKFHRQKTSEALMEIYKELLS